MAAMVTEGQGSDEAAREDSAEMTLGAVHFDGLSPTDFEEFCFDLLADTGFVDLDWRKGTPMASSPADRGRDIVAHLEREDVDGYTYRETWFVDCKHYKRGVPPEALHGTITWAQAERPSVVLFIASGYLTNGAKDWIATLKQSSNPPFRIRVWEMPQIRRLLVDHMDIAFKHDVETSSLRRVSELLAAESELTDKLWYGRKPADDQPVPADWKPEIVSGMRAAQRRMEEQYGKDELLLHVKDQFAWGMLSGKVSAIRWVLGEDWDMLDS
jgi:hypothetical protein